MSKRQRDTETMSHQRQSFIYGSHE